MKWMGIKSWNHDIQPFRFYWKSAIFHGRWALIKVFSTWRRLIRQLVKLVPGCKRKRSSDHFLENYFIGARNRIHKKIFELNVKVLHLTDFSVFDCSTPKKHTLCCRLIVNSIVYRKGLCGEDECRLKFHLNWYILATFKTLSSSFYDSNVAIVAIVHVHVSVLRGDHIHNIHLQSTSSDT